MSLQITTMEHLLTAALRFETTKIQQSLVVHDCRHGESDLRLLSWKLLVVLWSCHGYETYNPRSNDFAALQSLHF